MNKEQMQELMMGVALVALAYALYQHFKANGTIKTRAPGQLASGDPTRPDAGYGYDPYNPGDFIKWADLLKGTVADVITGQTAGFDIPTTKDLFGTLIAEQNGTTYQPTAAPYKEGALW